MSKPKRTSATEAAASRVRSIVMECEPGTLLGSEEDLVTRLGCSRATVRQVARLLEREGLLKVRRGLNGGYFAARPDAGTIEATVAAYLDMLDVDPLDTTLMATVLWTEAMRKAALAGSSEIAAMVERLTRRVRKVDEDASFSEVRDAEFALQADVFALARSPYIKLIFDVNIAYSRRRLTAVAEGMDSAAGAEFVKSWKAAKLMELQAIASKDPDLAASAGQHGRRVWHDRVRLRHTALTTPASA